MTTIKEIIKVGHMVKSEENHPLNTKNIPEESTNDSSCCPPPPASIIHVISLSVNHGYLCPCSGGPLGQTAPTWSSRRFTELLQQPHTGTPGWLS